MPLQYIFKVFLVIYILQEDIEVLGQNIIEVFEGFTSQEGLEIFISSFTLAKLVEKRFCYVEESFHGAAAGLIMCMMMIISKCIFFKFVTGPTMSMPHLSKISVGEIIFF